MGQEGVNNLTFLLVVKIYNISAKRNQIKRKVGESTKNFYKKRVSFMQVGTFLKFDGKITSGIFNSWQC